MILPNHDGIPLRPRVLRSSNLARKSSIFQIAFIYCKDVPGKLKPEVVAGQDILLSYMSNIYVHKAGYNRYS